MFKRLLFSLMTITAVVGSVVYGAFAYFVDNNSTNVSVHAGNAELKLYADSNCDTMGEGIGLDTLNPPDPFPLATNAAPGEYGSVCIVIKNEGTVPLDVYLRNSSFIPPSANELMSWLEMTAQDLNSGNYYTSYAVVYHSVFTSGKGLALKDELGAGASFGIKLWGRFIETDSDQSMAEGQTAAWTISIDGYTD